MTIPPLAGDLPELEPVLVARTPPAPTSITIVPLFADIQLFGWNVPDRPRLATAFEVLVSSPLLAALQSGGDDHFEVVGAGADGEPRDIYTASVSDPGQTLGFRKSEIVVPFGVELDLRADRDADWMARQPAGRQAESGEKKQEYFTTESTMLALPATQFDDREAGTSPSRRGEAEGMK